MTENPVDTALRDALLRRVDHLAGRPREQLAFVNGILLDGTAERLGLKSGLAQFMTLPPAEAKRLTRARMAELILTRVAAEGRITRDDLAAADFSDKEIAEHFTAARRIAQVERMAA